MPLINYATREITFKLVYYGTGLGGKTTNLMYIHSQINPSCRGDLISLRTETERTLFFEYMPIEVADLGSGFKMRVAIYTVPGQEEYDQSRKQVLRGADGIVFVADSNAQREKANIDSMKNMHDNLRYNDLSVQEGTGIPWVLQYNKRDLTNAMPVERMQSALNPTLIPAFESIAIEGYGVLTTLKAITKLMVNKTKQTK